MKAYTINLYEGNDITEIECDSIHEKYYIKNGEKVPLMSKYHMVFETKEGALRKLIDLYNDTIADYQFRIHLCRELINGFESQLTESGSI